MINALKPPFKEKEIMIQGFNRFTGICSQTFQELGKSLINPILALSTGQIDTQQALNKYSKHIFEKYIQNNVRNNFIPKKKVKIFITSFPWYQQQSVTYPEALNCLGSSYATLHKEKRCNSIQQKGGKKLPGTTEKKSK